MQAMYYLLILGSVMLFLSVVAWRDAASAAKRSVKIARRRD